MKRILFFCCLIINFNFLFAQNIFTEFLQIYNSYSDKNNAYYFTQGLKEYNKEGIHLKTNSAYSICFDNNEITCISQINDNLYFLSNASGYWIKNKKLKTPMKISGSYKVMDVQMQDLLRLDFVKDYKIEIQNDKFVLLKKVNKKNSYSYIKLYKDSSNFKIDILDNNQKKFKSIVYVPGVIKDLTLFTCVSIYDEFLNIGAHSDFVTLDVKPVSVSKNLFNKNYMDELITILDKQ